MLSHYSGAVVRILRRDAAQGPVEAALPSETLEILTLGRALLQPRQRLNQADEEGRTWT